MITNSVIGVYYQKMILAVAAALIQSLPSCPFFVQALAVSPKPLGTAMIDYSAMNEYVKEHYGPYAGAEPYFPQDMCQETVYNGRAGVLMASTLDDNNNNNNSNNNKEEEKVWSVAPASLHSCGFQLCHVPTTVTDWTDMEQLQSIYLPELRALFAAEFGADNLLHLEFFHPMLRGENLTMTTTIPSSSSQQQQRPQQQQQQSTTQTTTRLIATSPTAAMAHIDNDIGAFEPERVVGLVQNNCISYYQNQENFPRQAILNVIEQGHRFLVVNCWRNAGTASIQRAPLGIFATSHQNPLRDCFPAAQPDLKRSHWYVFPEMTSLECLLFKQYDRDVRFVSDLWHCAMHSLSKEGASPRMSMDVRAFVVLKERTPKLFDRYASDRIRPILSYEQSEKFCRSQGEARKERRRSTTLATS